MKLSRGIIISKTLFNANIIFGTPSGNEVTKFWTFSLWNGIKNWEAFTTKRFKERVEEINTFFPSCISHVCRVVSEGRDS